jgi:hypothetical protein
MKHVAWMSAGILAFVGSASPCAAQGSPLQRTAASEEPGQVPIILAPFRTRPCLPGHGTPCPPSSTMPGTPDPSPTPSPTTSAPDFSGAGEFKSSTGRTSSVFAGTGIGGAVTGDPILTGVLTPLILPGLLTATAGQSALPVDRLFFEYGYFNRVAVNGVGSSAPMLVRTTTTTQEPIFDTGHMIIGYKTITTVHNSVAQSSAPVAGFNLNTFNIGVEKTFLDGLASAYVSVPFLYATDNISGQDINGIGDVNAGFKLILYQSLRTGNTLTGGFTISFPSGHAAVSNSFLQSGNGTGDALLPSSSVSVNPTYFQPWLAGLLIFDRLYVHEYFAVVVPSDGRVATFLTSDFTLGYSLIRANDDGLLTSVTPTLGIQALIPVSNRGTPTGQGTTTFVPFAGTSLPAPPAPSPFTFTDQVFVSGGVQLGLGERWLFSANVVVPVAGPRAYNIGATFGLNYFY